MKHKNIGRNIGITSIISFIMIIGLIGITSASEEGAWYPGGGGDILSIGQK